MIVENSTHENISQLDSNLDGTANAQDNILGRSLISTVRIMFVQCSEDLFNVCIMFFNKENSISFFLFIMIWKIWKKIDF